MNIFKLLRTLLNNIGSVGLRADQANLYIKDMYKVGNFQRMKEINKQTNEQATKPCKLGCHC